MRIFKKFTRKKVISSFIAIFGFMLLAFAAPVLEEGMYPLSEIHKVNLKDAGLKIDVKDVYNPDGISLVDALVNVGGCTGSFVSEDGLIITNHHCVFGALQAASTVENDYIEKGFKANTHEEEIEAKGTICRITDSYDDVSDEILNSVKEIKDPAERTKKIEAKIKEIEKSAEKKDSTIQAQVSEMFEGKTYVLFRYKVIKDVRIVYVPPRTIGEFGGESDNWVWPRHTGDFSFMRAYVSKDGKPAEFSKDNVPYKPKKFLKVNPNGAEEGDFLFILGYPGRTFRHKPAAFLEFQEKYQLPYISDLYDYQIDFMKELSKQDPEENVKLASRIKSLANVTKNYKGKLKGLRELSLVENKKNEEREIQKFIDADKNLKSEYGNLFEQTNQVYSKLFKNAKRDLWLSQIFRASTLLRAAEIVLKNAEKLDTLKGDKKEDHIKNQVPKTVKSAELLYNRYSEKADKELLAKMIIDAKDLPENSNVQAIEELSNKYSTEKEIRNFVNSAVENNKIADPEYFKELLTKSKDEILALNNPLISLANGILKQEKSLENERKKIEGTLDELSAQLIEVKRLYKKQSFVPDANSTLRLTFGYVKGYSPVDAVYYKPVTTLEGIIEKSYQGGDYKVYEKLVELFNKKDFGKFYSKKAGGLPVAILYNMDTTGGNSGSPILNAYGELIGVNFDRAYEATINDYAWSEDYSRSIGVDIRYVLWVTQKIGGADFLLKEMKINL